MKSSQDLRKNWQEIREKLKIKFVKLTDNDVLFEEDQKTEMTNRLHQKLGIPKEEIRKIIADL